MASLAESFRKTLESVRFSKAEPPQCAMPVGDQPEWSVMERRYRKSLSRVERKAIDDYVGPDYGVNDILREKEGKLGYIYDKRSRQLTRDLDSALGRAVRLDKDVVLFRGIEIDDSRILFAMKPGARVADFGFVSTTNKRAIAEKFAGAGKQEGLLLEIHVQKGKHAAVANIVEKENYVEVLLPRCSMGNSGQFVVREVCKESGVMKRVIVDYVGY